ncbi:MAG TPA: lipid A deacylase LpxR family protein [Verrucomicrobiales bacterium]|nr:lipid A deacylase LpxR family protein [Verrucomicrobiales bacterium]
MNPFFATILTAALVGAAFAADTSAESQQNLPAALSRDHNHGYLSLFFDNDTFGGTDENYTNGVRLSWISPSLPVDRLSGFYRNLDWLLHRMDWQGGTPWLYQYGISLTQLMFTPADNSISELIPDDRPYAGWLGLGFSLHAKTDSLLHSLELSVGVVGPSSLAENSQDLIHDLRNIDKAQGWDNQLEDELTINLHYRRTKQLFEWSVLDDGFEMDGLYRWGFELGNAWINVNGGAYMRAGWNLPSDFSDPKLSATAYTHQLFTERRERLNPWSLFFTVGAEGKVVGRDIFLDGNTFEDSHSVDKRHFVADLTAGVTVRYKQLRVSYAHSYRTEEFAEQEGGQYFGSVSMGFAF